MKSNFLKMVVPASLLVTTFLSGCGGYQKDPVTDLAVLRDEAKLNAGPNKARVVTNNVIVEKPVAVPYAESKVDDKSVVVTADPYIIFSEGNSSSYNIRAKVLLPGVKIKLTAQGLPPGATLTESPTEVGLYILSWKPAIYTVKQDLDVANLQIKLVAEVLENASENKENAAKLKGLFREHSLVVFVKRTEEVPSNVVVNGLTGQVEEGQIVPFTVTAIVPGIDAQSAKKPSVSIISYDGTKDSAGKDFLEMDGSRHVIADINNKEPKYLGDSKWQFNLLIDTKNISIQPQLAKNGSIMPNADGTRVRMSIKVLKPSGIPSTEQVIQLKLAYNLSMTAPKFEVLGLGQTSLAVSRGEIVTLKFRIASADTKSETKLIASGSTLPGEPKVSCESSSVGAQIQDCTMTWTVPCDVPKDKLSGTVDMKAQNITASRQSEASVYSLKVTPAAKEKNLCVVPKVEKTAVKTEAVKSETPKTEAVKTETVAKPAVAKPPVAKPAVKTTTSTAKAATAAMAPASAASAAVAPAKAASAAETETQSAPQASERAGK